MDDHGHCQQVPYGLWPSPVTPELVGAGRVSMSGLVVVGDRCWWSESRPGAGGRQVVVRATLAAGPTGPGPSDATGSDLDVRSRVHEYGGGGFAVLADGDLVVADAGDGGLWWVGDVDGVRPSAGTTRRITPPPPPGERHRFGDLAEVPGSRWVVAVRERHCADGQVIDDLVAVAVDGSGQVVVLAQGHDLYAAPRPSPEADALAYLWWDHPRMPWDGTHLAVVPLDLPGQDPSPAPPRERAWSESVAGGDNESVGQPQWVDGWLWFTSDRAGLWQPWRWSGEGMAARVCDEPAEFHSPDWALGQRTMAPLTDGGMAVRLRRDGRDHIGILDPSSGRLHQIDQPWVTVSAMAAWGDQVVVMGATATEPMGVGIVGPDAPARWVASPAPAPIPARSVSVAEPAAFETSDGQVGHMLVYRPAAGRYPAPPGGLPPLMVLCHGGPTGACEPGMDLGVQTWTSRGFMVAAVDYRGSSGYGRAYRRMLDGRWGELDAQDVQDAAWHLVRRSVVDRGRLAVRGSSAGGLTALRAASVGGPFRAAVVAYGVTDLRALAATTHKFESHYLDTLVGPLPQSAGRYDERSPALHPEQVGAALLLFQGSDDPIVPPEQAERMAEAVRRQGLRCDHVVFAGEGHGFRRADTLREMATTEVRFVQESLGLC